MDEQVLGQSGERTLYSEFPAAFAFALLRSREGIRNRLEPLHSGDAVHQVARLLQHLVLLLTAAAAVYRSRDTHFQEPAKRVLERAFVCERLEYAQEELKGVALLLPPAEAGFDGVDDLLVVEAARRGLEGEKEAGEAGEPGVLCGLGEDEPADQPSVEQQLNHRVHEAAVPHVHYSRRLLTNRTG